MASRTLASRPSAEPWLQRARLLALRGATMANSAHSAHAAHAAYSLMTLEAMPWPMLET